MFGPPLRQTTLLIRFAIVTLTALAMAKFLPRAVGAEASRFAASVSDAREAPVPETEAEPLEFVRTFPAD